MSPPSGGKNVGPQKSQGLGDDQYTAGESIFKPVGEIPTPDLGITEKEDENILLGKEASTETITQDLDLPLRPGYGEQKFIMRTNYFQLTLDTKKELVRYNVKIEPAPNSSARALQNGRKRRHFYKTLFEDQPDFQARGHGIATDYAHTLFTCGRLYAKSISSKEYLQVYRGEMEQRADQNSAAQPSEQKYKVTVEYTGVVSSSELIRYVNSQPNDPSDFNSRLDVVQAMNIIVAGSPNKNEAIFQAGQNKFFQYPRNINNQPFDQVYHKQNLRGGLIAVRGYYSSVRTSTSRILLNLNAQCSAFYPEINLLDLMYVFVGIVGKDVIPSEAFQDIEEFIQRLRVRTEQTTREGNIVTREQTIRGFSHKHEFIYDRNKKKALNADGSAKMKGTKGADRDYGSSDSITFLNDAHSPPKVMSVSKYFLEKYGNPLRYPKALVVNCGTDESPKWIPPERCIVMPGQPYRGTLSEEQTNNMLIVAARGPSENARRISGDGLSVIGMQPSSQTLNAFGITVSTKMLSVHARLLPVPSVMYDNASFTPNLAGWNLQGRFFVTHVPIDKWSYLTLGKARISNEVWDLFQRALKACGMGEIQPDPYEGFHANLDGIGDNDFNDAAIRAAMSVAEENGVRILWVVLPTNSALVYARVKYWGDVEYGIHTVCVLWSKLKDKRIGDSMMYYANVTHKFNLKLGGINHKVSEKDLGVICEQATMVVGIDVTHPAPGSMEDAPSTVGMVASVDNQFGQWPGSLKIQTGRQEILKRRKEKEEKGLKNLPEGEEVMVEGIEGMLDRRLLVYYVKNQRLPTNILIYRDGVSETQYQAVLDLELKPIQEKCKKRYDERNTPPPKITIVIVAKRHHTRFYPTDSAYVDKYHFASKDDKIKGKSLGNPLNGTVVDRGITMHKGWDFYLQSHVALKGTARPTHYVVIHDEIGLGEGKLEKITHNLCYHYGIATKAVSICPPAYYADILCERGRCYLMKHLSMRDKPPGTKFVMAKSPWQTGVHEKLKNSMFYI